MRAAGRLRFLIDGRVAHEMEFAEERFGKAGFTYEKKPAPMTVEFRSAPPLF